MKNSINNLLAAMLAVLVISGSIGVAEDWPQWRGAARDGKNSETGLFEYWGENGPPVAWVAEGMGSGYASVSVVDGRIYTTGNFEDGQAVVCVDAKTGEQVWKTSLTEKSPKHGYPGSRSTPSIDIETGHLYLVTSAGSIECLSSKDGSLVWQRSFNDWGGKMMSGWGFSESPLIDGDWVLCTPGGKQGMVVALNKATGEEVWASKLPAYESETGVNGKGLKDGAGYSSVVISEAGGVKQYIQLVGRGLIGIRASDGEFLWRYDRVSNGTANIPTAIVDGEHVFTSTGYGTGSALLQIVADGNGKTKVVEKYWLDGKTMQNKHGGMVLVDGHIYCGTGNGNGLPICVNMASGDVAWGPERAEGKGETSLVYADGHIVMRRDDGTVMLLRATPEKLDILNSFKPNFQQGKSWAHPVISGGRLYLREQDKLMCYRVAGGA